MLGKLFPFTEWFQNYRISYLKMDVMAGLTVALVLIPQSMAYAQLAGLPPFYGLYAALLPPVVAALFGSSRQMATGPVAVVSLMTAVALEPLATAGSAGYISFAVLLALIVGAFQFLLGILRLGHLVNFLSHPVVNGFSNAAAIIIATSQLPKLLGVSVEKADRHYQTIVTVIQAAVHYTHWPTLWMGLLAFGIMFGLKNLSPRIPYVLAAVVVTTAISWLTGFENKQNVALRQIHSLQTRKMIEEYNHLVARSEFQTRKLSQYGRDLLLAKSGNDPEAQINIMRNMDIARLNIDRLKDNQRSLKDSFRRLLLVEVETDHGDPAFRPLDGGDNPAAASSRIWRLTVGNGPLDIDQLMVSAGGEVVGSIPRGLPAWKVPAFEWQAFRHLLPFAVVISLLGFMEAISIARAMAAKTGQRIDPNQELIGQGLANMIGSMARSYPTSGSFSRSAVNLQSGAISGLSSVITGLTVMITLLFFTPLLYHLPQSVLAAVIMVAVMGLINVNGIVYAWKAQWYDGLIAVTSFVCTLFFAPHLERGIFIGVGLSLAVFLYKSMRPAVADLSLGVDRCLHDAVEFGLRECKYIGVVRFDGPLFFANASYLEDQIRQRRMGKKDLKHIIIVANGINDIDASGQEALAFVIDRVRAAGIDISFSGVNESVMKVIRRTHLLAKIGKDHIYPNIQRAIEAVHAKTHRGGKEQVCPLTTVMFTSGCKLAEED